MAHYIELEGQKYRVPTDDPSLPSYVLPELRLLLADSEFCWDMHYPSSRIYHPELGIVDLAKVNRYIPKKGLEDEGDYEQRLLRSPFPDNHQTAVGDMVNLLSAFTVLDDTPSEILDILDNVNGLGDSLNQYLRDLDRNVLNQLLCGIYVEFPSTEYSNLYEQRRSKDSPWLVSFSLSEIPNFYIKHTREGSYLARLTLITTEQEESQFGLADEVLYKVLTPGECQTYRIVAERVDGKVSFRAEAVGEPQLTGLNYIPFVFYTLTGSFKSGQQPLMFPSAKLNLQLFKRISEINTILWATMPTPYRKGVKARPDGTREPMVLGPSYGVDLPADGAFGWEEPAGASLAMHFKDLERILIAFKDFNASFFADSVSGLSATEATLRSVPTTSQLFGMAMTKESAIQSVFRMLADFKKSPKSGGIVIEKQLLKPPLTFEQSMILLEKDLITREAIQMRYSHDIDSPKSIPGKPEQ